MEASITYYLCSECGTRVSSEGTEASDHMLNTHGVDNSEGPQEDSPYLIPEESNPTLDENGVPT